MAGSGKHHGKEALKNKAMLVVRNITEQEVTNVIFPNGLTVGTVDLKNGAKIHGNVQVAGTLNAQDLRINGTSISEGPGAKFLLFSSTSPFFAFPESSSTSPSPDPIVLSVLQASQSSTIPGTGFQVSGSDGSNLTGSLSGDYLEEFSTGNCYRTVNLSYDDSSMRSVFPITASVSHEGITQKTYIHEFTASTPAFLVLDLDSTVASFDDSSDTTPDPSSVDITVTQAGQASTIVVGDISATSNGGSAGDLNGDISSFSNTSTSTGNSVSTATLSLPSNQSSYPITVSVSNDSLSSSKKIGKAVGGDDGTTPTVTFQETIDISYDFSDLKASSVFTTFPSQLIAADTSAGSLGATPGFKKTGLIQSQAALFGELSGVTAGSSYGFTDADFGPTLTTVEFMYGSIWMHPQSSGITVKRFLGTASTDSGDPVLGEGAGARFRIVLYTLDDIISVPPSNFVAIDTCNTATLWSDLRSSDEPLDSGSLTQAVELNRYLTFGIELLTNTAPSSGILRIQGVITYEI